MESRRSGPAWASLAAGVASVAAIPIAVIVTRSVQSYRLVEAGYAIPLGVLLALLALLLARRARRELSLRLGRTASGEGMARTGRLLGLAGLCIAASAVVSLVVYGLLQYAGSSG